MFYKNKKLVLVVVLLFALTLSAFDTVESADLATAFEGEGDTEEAYCSAAAEKEHPGLSRLANIYELEYEELQALFCEGGYDIGVIKQVFDYVASQDEDDPDATFYTADDIFAMIDAAGGDWDAVKAELKGAEAEEDGIDDLDDVEDEGEESARGYYCAEDSEREHPSLAKVAEDYELDYATVQEWFCEGGHGVGSIKNALKAGQTGDLSAEELFEMYEEYGNWGQVKKALKEVTGDDASPGKSGDAPGKDKDKGKPDKDKGKPEDNPGKGNGKNKDG